VGVTEANQLANLISRGSSAHERLFQPQDQFIADEHYGLWMHLQNSANDERVLENESSVYKQL